MDTRYSTSETDLYKSCQLAYQMRRVIGLRPRTGGDSHALRYGHALHEALAVLYRTGYAHLDSDGQRRATNDAQEVFALDYPESYYPPILPRYDVGKTFDHGLAAIADYVDRWVAEDRDWEVLSCEAGETFESGGVVHLDLVARYRPTGQIIGWDHKSGGKYLDGEYWQKFLLSDQIRRYMLFIQERYGSCDGFMINAIMLKYRSRAYTRGDDHRPGQTYWHEFGRQIYNPNQATLELARENANRWSRMIDASIADDTWTYDDSSCWKCPGQFNAICEYGYRWPQDAPLILENYRVVCGEPTANLRQCELDIGHDGEHAEWQRLPIDANDDNDSEESMVVMDDDE